MDAEGEEELQERPYWRQNSYCQFIMSARKIGHPSTSVCSARESGFRRDSNLRRSIILSHPPFRRHLKLQPRSPWPSAFRSSASLYVRSCSPASAPESRAKEGASEKDPATRGCGSYACISCSGIGHKSRGRDS